MLYLFVLYFIIMAGVSKLGGKVLGSQSREIVSNVYKFMKQEAEQNEVTIPLSKARRRTAAATGVSERVVTKINNELRQIENCNEGEQSFLTPNKKRRKIKPVTGLDTFDQCVVRRVVYDFCTEKMQLPTAELIKEELEKRINFKGSEKSVRLILKELGFRWRKTRNNRKLLIEKSDIREKRISYLQALKKYREEGRPIVYMDETYVLSSHVSGKTWSDESNKGIHAPISKGDRLIIIHAGGEKGFIPGALTMWKASSSSGDYHQNMNKTNYIKWINEKLLPNLEPRTILVIDNAPYHNVQVENPPNSNCKKEDMKLWLQRKGIPFSDSMLKPQLYKLINLYKGQYKKYVMNELLENKGHDVLRLPPYHPDLNPIELIWADVKGFVARHNVSFNLNEVMKLCEQKFSEMGPEEWAPKLKHVQEVDKLYRQLEPKIDDFIESFVIDLSDGSSDSDSDDDSGLEGIDPL